MTEETSKDLIELLDSDLEDTLGTFDSYRSASNPEVVMFIPNEAVPPFRFKAGGWELVQRSIDLGPAMKTRIAEKGFFMCRLIEEEPDWIELNDLAAEGLRFRPRTVPTPRSLPQGIDNLLLRCGARSCADDEGRKQGGGAYQQQKIREMPQRIQNERVAADLAELHRLRRYLIFKSESGGPREALLSAIDDYVEVLTGDRNKLHDHRHSSIG